jgi:hypothetical protein
VLIVVVGVEVKEALRKVARWRFGQQHECFQCPKSRLPPSSFVIRERERRRPEHSARTHPTPQQRAPQDLRRPAMLRAKWGQRRRRGFSRTKVDSRAASGTIEAARLPCLCVCPPARAMTMTKTRLTHHGGTRFQSEPCASLVS